MSQQPDRAVRTETGAALHKVEDRVPERYVGIAHEICSTEGDRGCSLRAPEWREICETLDLVQVEQWHGDAADETARVSAGALMHDGAFVQR